MVSRTQTDQQATSVEPSTVESLLEAATQVFMETGFAGARVDQIARQAQVNKAMIYYHFRSKRGLYQAVLGRLFHGVLDEIARIARDEPDPQRRLIMFYAGMARLFGERRALPHIMLREVLSGGESLDSEGLRVLTGIVVFVRDAIEKGVREGSVRDVNPLVVHLSALAPLVLFFVSQELRDRLLPATGLAVTMPKPEELLDYLALLIERGLEPEAGGSGRRAT